MFKTTTPEAVVSASGVVVLYNFSLMLTALLAPLAPVFCHGRGLQMG